jgi:hypothetical protein
MDIARYSISLQLCFQFFPRPEQLRHYGAFADSELIRNFCTAVSKYHL